MKFYPITVRSALHPNKNKSAANTDHLLVLNENIYLCIGVLYIPHILVYEISNIFCLSVSDPNVGTTSCFNV
jgi:hypothetical protein